MICFYPAEHFYIITESIDEIPKNLPVIRDFDHRTYFKEDAGKMLVGIFEGKSIPAFNEINRVPENFSFGEFAENFEQFLYYIKNHLTLHKIHPLFLLSFYLI